jgi:hypothetical protein
MKKPMKNQARPLLALLALLSALAAGARAEDAATPEPSVAERLLFMQPHLGGIKVPATLHYEFVRSDSAEGGGFKDSVTVQLAKAGTRACCKVNGSFLSGARALRLPEVDDAVSNPVLMYFLEYEVRELQRATRGGVAHFRRQMRLALVDRAEIAPTRIQWAGREVEATSVQVSPFLDDPYRARFEREAQKRYTFVMSDAVPGGVYQIRSLLPSAAATAVVEETLTLMPR